eukprot:363169-Chlamydomonas_euryale.AAC.32
MSTLRFKGTCVLPEPTRGHASGSSTAWHGVPVTHALLVWAHMRWCAMHCAPPGLTRQCC